MVIRPAVLGTAAVLSASLLVPATIATAAVAAPPSKPSASASSGAITDVTQQQKRLGALHYVRVAVAVSAPTVVYLADASGEVVAAEDATPEHPAVFQVRPNGDDTARYTVRDGASERTVDVDFRGLGLSAPVEQLDDRQIDRLQREVVAGQLDHEIRYDAVPGAEVTVSANGHSSTGVADADGVAVVDLHFVRGDNDLTAQQTLNGKSSDAETSHYLFDTPGSGEAGGRETGASNASGRETGASNADGRDTGSSNAAGRETGSTDADGRPTGSSNADGRETGGGDGGTTVPSDDAFAVDVDPREPIPAVDGTVTITGTATRGEVTVSSGRGEPLTTAPVQDGRWSATVPAGSQRVIALRFELRQTAGGPVTNTIEQPVFVASAPTTPFQVEYQAAYHREDGRVHLTGTAPAGEVTVLRSRERLGTTTAADGTWELDVPLAVGRHGLRFVFQPDGAGSTQEETALVSVVD